jgi:hypothetical protein
MSVNHIAKLLLLKLFIISGLQSAVAAEFPDRLILGTSDFNSKSLGGVCNTINTVQDLLPCNPAMLADQGETTFTTQFFLGNNVSYVEEVAELLGGKRQASTLRRLFNEEKQVQMEGNIEAAFKTELFGLSFSPYRLTYYSYVRNQALPMIALHVMQEQSLKLSFASFVEEDWAVGLQSRLVKRRFIAVDLSLTDVIGEQNEDFLPRQDQNVLFLEPGIWYRPEAGGELAQSDWSPVFSATVTNLGFADEKNESLALDPIFNVGLGAVYEGEWGQSGLGLNYAFNSDYISELDPLSVGASLGLGVTQFTASLSNLGYALGALIHFDGLRASITLEEARVNLAPGDDRKNKTVYTQVGFAF